MSQWSVQCITVLFHHTVSHSVHDHYFLHVQETVCYWSEPIPPNKGIHHNDSKPERYVSCDLSASDD